MRADCILAAMLLSFLSASDFASNARAATPATQTPAAPTSPVPALQADVIKRYGIVPFRGGNAAAVAQSSAAITPTCSSPKLTYFNGPVVSNVQVVPVMWGTYVNTQVSTGIAQFYSDAVISNWYDMLSEYASVGVTNQSIGRGTSATAFTITPSRCAATTNCTVTDAQLQAELAAQIQAGNLPAPQQDSAGNTNTAYMVHFPPNITLQGPDGGGTSCVAGGFCAYHNTGTFGANNIALPYGAMMDYSTGACSQGCGGNTTAFQNTTSVSSHELSELVTDTDIGLLPATAPAGPPMGWYALNNNCGEIADICDTSAPGSTITVSGRSWIVQQLWSNKLNACVGVGLKPNYLVGVP